MTPDYYSSQSVFSDPGRHAALVQRLPAQVDELAQLVRALCLYDVVAQDFYGQRVSAKRQDEIHLRGVEAMLDRLLALEGHLRPRPPAKRLVGRCHHYALLLTSMLRARGISARARCGFGRYFNPGFFEDHWVCEYFDARARRWILVDAQLDDVWRSKLAIRFDPDDVPRSEFLVAADAWNACRREGANAAKFGIEFVKLRGLWFIAGSLVRDLASLNKMEMLPWDTWGAQPQPNAPLASADLVFFDRLARLTLAPEATFAELTSFYAADDRVRVPPQVFNALRQRVEAVGELEHTLSS
jgi:hypothetical protein